VSARAREQELTLGPSVRLPLEESQQQLNTLWLLVVAEQADFKSVVTWVMAAAVAVTFPLLLAKVLVVEHLLFRQ
jgi:hypothetical protein